MVDGGTAGEMADIYITVHWIGDRARRNSVGGRLLNDEDSFARVFSMSGTPSTGSSQQALQAELLDTQAELENTRAVVAAARLRSVLRSRRALALGRAWGAWSHAVLKGEVSSVTAPLVRELAVLRSEVADQREREVNIRELRVQLAAARASDEELAREREAVHGQLADELARCQRALSASQDSADTLREEATQLRADLATSQDELVDLRANSQSLRAELDGAAGMLREGFAEAASQGARLASEEHGLQLVRVRLGSALAAAHASHLSFAFGRWAVGAAAASAGEERSVLREENGRMKADLHTAKRRCAQAGALAAVPRRRPRPTHAHTMHAYTTHTHTTHMPQAHTTHTQTHTMRTHPTPPHTHTRRLR